MRLRTSWAICGATFAILYLVKGGGWPTLAQVAFWAAASLFVGTMVWIGGPKRREHQGLAEDAGRRFGERHRPKLNAWIKKK